MSLRTTNNALGLATNLTDKLVRNMIFMDYTKRYNDWIVSIPKELFNGQGSINDYATKNIVRVYIDLCSEEFYLHKKGLIEDEIWNIWSSGMRDIFKYRRLEPFWKVLAVEYDDDFVHFINHEIIG